jgi:serine protease DegQ
MLKKLWLIFAQACALGLAGLLVVQTLKPQWLAKWEPTRPAAAQRSFSSPSRATQAALPSPPASAVGLAQAAARAAPAVVSIATRGKPRGGRDESWQRAHPWADPERRGMGSGVIVDAGADGGFVLTNHHVIDGAQRIDVQLSDGREVEAELVGTDPETDLALLRVPLPRLPVVELGASRALQVGDSVLAIGNPFGVGQTVTAGIVSALQRQQLGINVFESFIQTDAAINPGNSGGALVDAAGRLVGINSAIYSRGGGSLGIGFAIPVELAQQVMQALRQDGRVERGWMGVTTRALSEELVEALRLPADLKGVLVAGVVQGAPADKAGVKPGDVILQVGERAVGSPDALLNAVAALKPDSKVQLQVQRSRELLQLEARVGRRPAPTR